MKIRLAVFDLDDTLTAGTTVWERAHREMGTWESHGDPYWEDFKKGKFGYNAFIRKDVACWKGLPLKKLMRAIRKMRYVPKLKETFRALRRRGVRTALVSSSIEAFANYVSRKFGIDHIHANELEVRRGRLTGRIKLKVPGMAKGRLVRKLKRRLKLKKSEVLAVGDSEYDLPMFRESGVSVTFDDADKIVRMRADHVIKKSNIYGLLGFI